MYTNFQLFQQLEEIDKKLQRLNSLDKWIEDSDKLTVVD